MNLMSPWTVLGWILVVILLLGLVFSVGIVIYAFGRVVREAYRHRQDAVASLHGIPAQCATCQASAQFRTESGPRCSRHITDRNPAGRKTYSERISSDA